MSWRERFEEANAERETFQWPENCMCLEFQTRNRTLANGVVVFADQCKECGSQLGGFIKKSTIGNPEMLPEWDEKAQDRWFEKRRRKAVADNTTTVNPWWDVYREYLKSPQWKLVRNKIIARQDGLCEGCRDWRISQVHHKTYDRVGYELLIDLVGLCDACHKTAHNRE